MKPLQFNKNGKFRILQISDLQDTRKTSVDTLEFLEAAIPAVKPDLIVLTGDQLDVVGIWGGKKAKKRNVRQAILDILAPIRESKIPFIATFGNHDCQTGVSNAEQAEFYNECENCVCFDSLDDGRPDAGTFNQLVMSSDGKNPALNIYVVDSNSANPDPNVSGGYDNVHPEQIEWCAKTSEELKAMNGGKAVPSILFQHIPVEEIYEVLKEAPNGTPNSCAAFRSRKGKSYILNDELVWQKGAFRESPSAPDVNSGQFDAALKQGDIFAMYFGHDHYNSFVGKYKGIDLGYCPGAGYNTYGLNPRAMRVFDFDESDVTKYETKIVDVYDFYKKPLYQPIKNFVYTHAPENVDAAIPFFKKVFVVLLILAAIFVLIGYLTSKTVVGLIFATAAAIGVIYTIVSFIRNAFARKRILSKYKK